MADDRFDPQPDPAAAEDDPATTAEMDRWLTENRDWVKARVQEALDDPRPPLTMEEVEARAQQRYARMLAKFGR